MRKKRQHRLIMTSHQQIITEEHLRTPQRMRISSPSSSANSNHAHKNVGQSQSQTQPTSLSIPPSPCATSTTSSPATNRSIESSLSTSNLTGTRSDSRFTFRYLNTAAASTNHRSGSGCHKNYNRVLPIPPSPSRSVLDPHYASRLYNSSDHQQHRHHPQESHLMIDANIMPPPQPGILHGISSKSSSSTTITNGFPTTPVHSVESEVDGDGAVNTSLQSTSTQFFTPERPKRNHNSYSPTSARGYHTPLSSPRGKSQSVFSSSVTPSRNAGFSSKSLTPKAKVNADTFYSDRFIPSRASSNLTFSVWDDSSNHNKANNDLGVSSSGNNNGGDGLGDMDGSGTRQDGSMNYGMNQSQQQPILNALLRSELLGENLEPSFSNNAGMTSPRNNGQRSGTLQEQRPPLTDGRNFLRYNQSQRQLFQDEVFRNNASNPTSVIDSFSLSPLGVKSSHRLINMPQKRKRKIAKVPFKVLDAPSLADDFYLNLVDWSSLNVLAVGLGSCVYLWSACTSKVTKLCDLGVSSQDSITSVAWTQRGTHLAVGVNNGEVQIWDTVKCKKIRKMDGHSARIGALSWSGATLASGSRDRLIYLRDVRIQQPFTARLGAHKQEVCGLKWSFDEPAHLASGGNDNKLLVWDIKNHRQPKHKFAEHTAAVKAIAWSPHQHGLLASGGGTADRCIRFWNALSGTSLNVIDTGSQVCNLSWSKNCNEIVSTHGYSLNQIAIWKYPTMQKVATLTGHTYRVLYLAMSPDGSTIVT